MKYCLLTVLFPFLYTTANSSPHISFEELLAQSEQKTLALKESREEASKQRLPVNIMTRDGIMFDYNLII